MKKNIFLFITISILSGFFFSNCNKEQQIGMNILPEEDNINTTIIDTFYIEVNTVLSEHLNTTNTPYLLLGSYIDPVFGSAKASFITQIQQEKYPNFPKDITLESIELYLPYIDSYGSEAATQEIYIYEISDSLEIGEIYYSDANASDFHNENLLGSTTFDPTTFSDSIIIIPLNDDFGQLLIDNEDYYFYSFNSSFSNIFKGLYVTTNSEAIDGAIFRLPINVPFSTTNNFKIVLSYSSESYPDSIIAFELPVSTNSVRFNLFEHDYSDTYFYDQLMNPFTINDSIAFIQSMAGTKIRVKIPFVENLSANKNLIINKAELVVKPDTLNSTEDYIPINELAFVGYDEEDDDVIFFDDFYNAEFEIYYGAIYYDNEYRLNVTRIIQSLISVEPYNFDFYFVDKSASYDFKRTVITTGQHSNPIKLVVTYTEY